MSKLGKGGQVTCICITHSWHPHDVFWFLCIPWVNGLGKSCSLLEIKSYSLGWEREGWYCSVPFAEKLFLTVPKNDLEMQSPSNPLYLEHLTWFISALTSDNCVLTFWTLLFCWQKRNQQEDDWGTQKHYIEFQARNVAKSVFSITIKLLI